MPLILLDERSPKEAKDRLSTFGELLFFLRQGVTEESVSGHPDIFFFEFTDGDNKQLIVAPNIGERYSRVLQRSAIHFQFGNEPVSADYRYASAYNAVCTEKYFMHKISHSDLSIRAVCKNRVQIEVPQGYSRCSTIHLKDNFFITSDRGIQKALLKYPEIDLLYVSPEGILLPGHRNGFWGGCAGIFQDKLFLLGSLDFFKDGEKVREYCKRVGVDIIELYPGPLYDGGGIFFLD